MRTHDGLHLDVAVLGDDDAPLTVVLAHCWTLTKDDWHYQVTALQAEFGHRVRIVTYDHRGHGASDPSPRADCTIVNLARDLGDLIDEVAPTGPVFLAGHSIGGMSVMALAQQRPDLLERVVGVLFVSTAATGMDSVNLGLPDMGPFLRRQIPRMLAFRARTLSRRARRRAPILEGLLVRRFVIGSPMRLADAALTVEGLVCSPADTVVGFYADMMDHHDRVEALALFDAIPTRVLVGTRDVLTPPSFARLLADELGCELLVAPDAGHMLPLERHELVSGTLISMLRSHVAAAS